MKRIAVAFGAYLAVMGALAVDRWNLWSYGSDTGTFTQIARNALSGFANTSERGSHLAVHWSPILEVLYPFARFAPAPGLAIQFVQIAAIGLGVFPAYVFFRRYANDGIAQTMAIVTLVYPPLLAVAFDEFHEVAFYPALVFALLLAIDASRWRWAIVCAALLILVREETLLILAAFGVVLAVAGFRAPRIRPRGLLFLEPREPERALAFGTGLAATALLLFVLYFHTIAPAFGGWTASHFYRYPFASGPLALVIACMREPLTVVHAIATPGRTTYLIEAFAPVLFLALRSPWMFVALPGLAVVVLSSDPSAWRMGNHYAGDWAPWLLLATFDRVVRFTGAERDGTLGPRLCAGIVAACAIVLVVANPLHPGHYLHAPYADRTDALRALAATPRDASVFTHDEWFAHAAGDRPALEHVWSEPDYAVLADDYPHPETFLPFMRRQLTNGCYIIVEHYAQVVVYRRTPVATSRAACRIAR